MHFLTFEWLAWLFTTVAFYWLMPPSWRHRGLVVITLCFLLLHAPESAAILILLTCTTYIFANWPPITGYRITIAASIVFVILIYYKMRIQLTNDNALDTLIPLGLSYYSFRCVHYLLERFRDTLGKHNFEDFICYLFFLPTIVVGPIHRFSSFINNRQQHYWSSALLSEGLERILYGYVKITVLGNYLISVKFVQYINSIDPQHTALINYLDILRGGLNVYFQFSGFADIAIGFSLLLGYRVMENFNWPLLQKNLSLLWRCWHISLTSWCRDYIYLPTLGLTRNPHIAMIATFTTIGLWHEISLRYLIWSLYNAAGIFIWQQFQKYKRKLRLPKATRRTSQMAVNSLCILLTVHYFFFGFVLVRQPNLTDAFDIYKTVLLFWL